MKNPTVTLVFGIFQVVVGILGSLSVLVMYLAGTLTSNWYVILLLSLGLLLLGLSEVSSYRKAVRLKGSFTVQAVEEPENPENSQN